MTGVVFSGLRGPALLEARMAELAAHYGRPLVKLYPAMLKRSGINLSGYVAAVPPSALLSEADRATVLAWVCTKLDSVRIVDGGES